MAWRSAIVVAAVFLVGLVPAQAVAAPRFAGAWKGTWKYVGRGGAQPKLGLGAKFKTEGDFVTANGATVFDYPFGGGEFKLKRHGASLRGRLSKSSCPKGWTKPLVTIKPTRSVKFEGVRWATAATGRLVYRWKTCDGVFRSKTYDLKLKRKAPKVRGARFFSDGDWTCGATPAYVVSFQAEDDDLPVDARNHAITRSWSFGDGATSGAPSKKESVKHSYAAAGSYQVSLSETLWDGSVARRTETLEVPPPECP